MQHILVEDVIYIIFNLLTAKSLGSYMCTSKYYRDVCSDNKLWNKLLLNDFSNVVIKKNNNYETYKINFILTKLQKIIGYESTCENLYYLRLIECSNDGKLKQSTNNLEYKSNICIDMIPIELMYLQFLKSLMLNNNNFTILPPEICQLINLQELILDNNKIIIIPKEIGQFVNLQHLSLCGNDITILPSELGNLHDLKTLSLLFNNIEHIPLEIYNLSTLQHLSLGHNDITVISSEIGNLSNLQTLSFEFNQINTIPKEIGNLRKLQTLNLSDNQIDIIPSELGNLIYLRKLYLANNNIEFLPDELNKLCKLKILNIQNNKVKTNLSTSDKIQNRYLSYKQNMPSQMPLHYTNAKHNGTKSAFTWVYHTN